MLYQFLGWHTVPRPDSGETGVFLYSWQDAGLKCYLFILALAKTPGKAGQAVTPAGAPDGAGATGAAITNLS